MRIPDEPDLNEGINILPMIDIIFSILAFFVISTLYLTRDQGLPVNLPSASTVETVTQEQIKVTIDSDGEIFLNQDSIKLEDLPSVLKTLVENQGQTLVIINADEKVEHGRVVEVMDYLRQVEGVKLAIAATNKNNQNF